MNADIPTPAELAEWREKLTTAPFGYEWAEMYGARLLDAVEALQKDAERHAKTATPSEAMQRDANALRADLAAARAQACPDRVTCVSDNWNAGFREAEVRYQPLLAAERANVDALRKALEEDHARLHYLPHFATTMCRVCALLAALEGKGNVHDRP